MKTTDYIAFVGLDWGDKTHAFALQLTTADKIETGTLPATAEALHQWLEQLRVRGDGLRVALAIEAGHRALLHVMAEHPWLDIFPIHPAMCDRYRAAFRPSGAKDDIPDARTLLTLVTQHREKLQRLRMDSAQTRELAGLALGRRHAVDRRTQLGSQLRTVLKGYFPQALELIGDEIERPLALDFLQRWQDLAAV